MSCEILKECEEKFKEIDMKLNEGDKKFIEIGCKIDNLISSQNTLTKALWGLAVSVFIALIGFVLGKI